MNCFFDYGVDQAFHRRTCLRTSKKSTAASTETLNFDCSLVSLTNSEQLPMWLKTLWAMAVGTQLSGPNCLIRSGKLILDVRSQCNAWLEAPAPEGRLKLIFGCQVTMQCMAGGAHT